MASIFASLTESLTMAKNRFVKPLLDQIDTTIQALDPLAKTRVINYQVEDLSADGDIAARVIFVAPAGLSVLLVSASIISQGTAAGIDDANTCVVALTDGTNSIVSKTFNTATAFPAAAAITDLGTLHATYKSLSAGEKLCLSVTNGSAANPPAFMLQVVYSIAAA
jgi:hypothetical protein